MKTIQNLANQHWKISCIETHKCTHIYTKAKFTPTTSLREKKMFTFIYMYLFFFVYSFSILVVKNHTNRFCILAIFFSYITPHWSRQDRLEEVRARSAHFQAHHTVNKHNWNQTPKHRTLENSPTHNFLYWTQKYVYLSIQLTYFNTPCIILSPKSCTTTNLKHHGA